MVWFISTIFHTRYVKYRLFEEFVYIYINSMVIKDSNYEHFLHLKVLCRWILSVRKNYRPVKYHNWRHALNVCQTMFTVMKTGKMDRFMDELEVSWNLRDDTIFKFFTAVANIVSLVCNNEIFKPKWNSVIAFKTL